MFVVANLVNVAQLSDSLKYSLLNVCYLQTCILLMLLPTNGSLCCLPCEMQHFVHMTTTTPNQHFPIAVE